MLSAFVFQFTKSKQLRIFVFYERKINVKYSILKDLTFSSIWSLEISRDMTYYITKCWTRGFLSQLKLKMEEAKE